MGALEAPQDRHRQERRTGTSRAEQTGTMAELGTLEAMAVQGALKAMVELGALGTMAELGALEAMADGLRGPRPRPPRPGPYSRNPTTPPPPQKISMGKLGGIRSPPGLNRQDSTKHDRTALQGQTDRTGHDDRKALQGPTDKTSHRNQKPSWASSEAEASSGHDQESGALTGSLSDRLHFSNKGAGG